MIDEDRQRRRGAKLVNERLKLLAAFCNTAGFATFITLVIAPAANGRAVDWRQIVVAAIFAFVLHAAGQSCLTLWRSED